MSLRVKRRIDTEFVERDDTLLIYDNDSLHLLVYSGKQIEHWSVDLPGVTLKSHIELNRSCDSDASSVGTKWEIAQNNSGAPFTVICTDACQFIVFRVHRLTQRGEVEAAVLQIIEWDKNKPSVMNIRYFADSLTLADDCFLFMGTPTSGDSVYIHKLSKYAYSFHASHGNTMVAFECSTAFISCIWQWFIKHNQLQTNIRVGDSLVSPRLIKALDLLQLSLSETETALVTTEVDDTTSDWQEASEDSSSLFEIFDPTNEINRCEASREHFKGAKNTLRPIDVQYRNMCITFSDSYPSAALIQLPRAFTLDLANSVEWLAREVIAELHNLFNGTECEKYSYAVRHQLQLHVRTISRKSHQSMTSNSTGSPAPKKLSKLTRIQKSLKRKIKRIVAS